MNTVFHTPKAHTYHSIGLMSGTSLDGLDIAYCVFTISDSLWSYQIVQTRTISYPNQILGRLNKSTQLIGVDLSLLNIELGKWIGREVSKFIEEHNLSIDLIASHGHTVFHQPNKGLTLQIGDGQQIFNSCGVTVVNDFRSKDVSMGGNGAPLVPIGDLLLFNEYDACLNLGGIANVSYSENSQRIAYDIVPVNIVLNMLAQQLGKPFDNLGDIARGGVICPKLLHQLNQLSYYKKDPPKSLGYEWVEKHVFPIVEQSSISIQDQLSTLVEHIAIQLSQNLPAGKTLITGGGTYNIFLIERLGSLTSNNHTLVIPNNSIVEFKEAMIFAFLGVLRLRNDINCLSSVTGASEDSSSGLIYSK